METQIIKSGRDDVFIADLLVERHGDSAGAVQHIVGSDEVIICSMNRSGCGSIPIIGKQNLKLLRDAMIEICKMEGIE